MATATSTSRAKNSSLASSDVKAAEALLAQVATMLPNIRVKAVFNPADGPGGPLPTLPPQGSYRNTSGRDCHDSSSRSASHYSSSFSVRPYDRQSDCGCDCDIYCDCSCEPCSCACNHKPRYYTKARPNEVYSSSVGVVASVQGSCSRGCREWYAKLDREKRVAMQAQSIHNKANNNNNTARSGDVSQQRGRAVGAVSVRVDTYSDLNAFDEDPDAPSYLVNKSVLVAEREAALLAWKKKRMEQLAEARFQREVDRQHQVQWSFSRKTAPSAADALVKRAIAHSTAANQEREARLRRKNIKLDELYKEVESLRRATAAQQAALQKEIEEKEALATRLSKTAGANESLAMRVGDLSLENEKLRATMQSHADALATSQAIASLADTVADLTVQL